MKQPSWKVPLILSSTVLVLGSFSYWLAYSHKPKQEKADTREKTPLHIPDDAQIASFRLKSTKGVVEGKCTSLEKKTCRVDALGDWVLTYPIQAEADEDAIKDMLSQFVNLKADETIDLSVETPENQKRLLDEYGLSDQKRTTLGAEFFEVTFENGKKVALWLGENHPIGNRIFAASSEDNNLDTKKIYLVPPTSKVSFDKPLTWFRGKTIFHFDRRDVKQFSAKVSDGRLEGVQKDGSWTINGKPGDRDRIETIFATIAQAKAKAFLPDTVLKGTKNTFQYKLEGQKEPVAFDLYFKINEAKEDDIANPNYYLKVAGRKDIYEVEFKFRDGIDKTVAYLRESALLNSTAKVTATLLTLSGKNYKGPAEFHFNGKDWSQTDKGQPVDAKQITSFLDLLINSHSKERVKMPKDTQVDTVTFTLGDEKDPKRYNYLFFSTKDAVYAKDLNSKENEAYWLDPKIKSALPFNPDQWKIK